MKVYLLQFAVLADKIKNAVHNTLMNRFLCSTLYLGTFFFSRSRFSGQPISQLVVVVQNPFHLYVGRQKHIVSSRRELGVLVYQEKTTRTIY